ncbi:MAG: PspA/IM30 family protein [Snowella sp.]|nr:PspA/IM30 family protein [Snowella sp.]
MSLLTRFRQVIRAQWTSLGQESQDPEKLLTEITAQMELELIEMRRALAEAIATHKSSERQLAAQQMAAQKWYERAQLAIDKDNENLAREALEHRQAYQHHIRALEQSLAEHQPVIQRLKGDLQTLERKYSEVKAKKSLYLARLKSATAAQKLQEMMGSMDNLSASSLFERLENKVLELEAQSDLTVLVHDPLEQKFATLEDQKGIEATLNQLKAQRRPLPPS